MYWSFDYKNQSYYSWGAPRTLGEKEYSNLSARYDVPVYSGHMIMPDENVVFSIQGDWSLGYGDSLWLISYLRDVYRIKSGRKANMHIFSSKWVTDFWKNFLPKPFIFHKNDFIPAKFFEEECQYRLPSLYFFKDLRDNTHRSWTDNKSILQRLYEWSGIEYNGLPDFGEFTNERIMYPPDHFWTKYKIDKKEKYVFFQWHSTAESKNPSIAFNIKLIKHIVDKYGLRVVVIGRDRSIDQIEKINGVTNLSGRTEGDAEALVPLALNSEFIVCPDSAGTHLSEAFKVPCVTLLSVTSPSYIASKYEIPSFMYGSGFCPYAPCGVIDELPKTTRRIDTNVIEPKCPKGTKGACRLYDEIDLNLFDRCVSKTISNRHLWRNRNIKETIDFYSTQVTPISLVH